MTEPRGEQGIQRRVLTRRRLVAGAAGAAVAAAAGATLPEALQHTLRHAVKPQPIEHVVLLMQENRSFDHYFGTMAGVRGFNDPNALRLPDGTSVFRQPDAANPDGYVLPFHLDSSAYSVQKIPSTSHSWHVQHAALNGGKMDSWLPAHRKADYLNAPYVMGYYERADLPFHFALADAFTVCDAYYCSVLGPTWPNRMMWMTGTIDPTGANGGPILDNVAPMGGFTWTTYAERLEKAGVSWKVYTQDDDYGLNVLKQFSRFQQASRDSPLYRKGIASSPEGTFESDARAGRLPAVSWIIPTAEACEHPDYRPADGAAFIAAKINAIAENPDVWAKTVFILNYDENDGLFDHIVPPLPQTGEADEFVDGHPIGGGYRVPCIIVSPWTAGGWVATEPFDHTSVLRFLEWHTGVVEPNISAWRRRAFGDLTSAIRLDQPIGKPVRFPTTAEVPNADAVDQLPAPMIPGKPQSVPQQVGGTKPRIP